MSLWVQQPLLLVVLTTHASHTGEMGCCIVFVVEETMAVGEEREGGWGGR